MSIMAQYPDLQGKRAFITGGGSGLGAGMVQGFANQGCIVGYCDLEDESKSTTEYNAERPDFFQLDVTDTNSLDNAIKEFATNHGGIDILINNVGDDRRQIFEDVSRQDFRKSMAVNVEAAFFATKCVANIIKDHGSIVNISSINPRLGLPGMSPYVTAKGALWGMTRALATELGLQNIRVNMISPGWIVTEKQLQRYLTPEAEEEWMLTTSLKRRLEVDDVVAMALFLASSEARGITGQEFIVDNGRT